MACRYGAIKCVNILLKYGADVHINDNTIINFVGDRGPNVGGICNWVSIAKLLLKYGAMSNDMCHTCYLYLNRSHIDNFDEELFIYFLDYGMDFNREYVTIFGTSRGKNILDAVVRRGSPQLLKLCLQYGADPRINNCDLLQTTITIRNLDSIKLLLDTGCILDEILEYKTIQGVIDLLDQYGISHKLKS